MNDQKALTVPEVVKTLTDVANHLTLGLPPVLVARGRQAPNKLNTPGTGPVRKGWAGPAPSVDLLRLAVDALPNDKGHFDDRREWMMVAYAIKGAAASGGFEAEGKNAWLDFCARWSWGGDPDGDEKAWDSIQGSGTGWSPLVDILNRVNPAGAVQLKNVEAAAAFDGQEAVNHAAITALDLRSVTAVMASHIPPREWVYGRAMIRGFVSIVVAPGGTGKSALTVLEALSMAAGRELLPRSAPHKSMRVWLHNAEDSDEEQLRRLAAAMNHHSIGAGDIGDRLFLTSGRTMDLTLARQVREGSEIVPGVVDGLVAKLMAARIDVLILDPLGALHTLQENSNEAANLLMGALREIADRAKVAIVLVYHTSKAAAGDMAQAGAGASRGASAFVDAARSVRQLATMSVKEAKAWSIADEDRRSYVRIDNGKANLAPAAGAEWIRLVGVPLGNGTAEYPKGDNVQTVESWEPPLLSQRAALTLSEKKAVQDAISAAEVDGRRASHIAEGWVGYCIGAILGLDIGEHSPSDNKPRGIDQDLDRKRVADIIRHGFETGWLIKGDEKCGGKGRPCVQIGNPIADVVAENV